MNQWGVRQNNTDELLTLAEESKSGLMGTERSAWLARMEAAHDDFQAVFLDTTTDPTIALRLCDALQPFWWSRGFAREEQEEGLRWSDAVIKAASALASSALYARVLNGAGVLARMLGNFTKARAYHEQSLAIRREIGDLPGTASSFTGLGNVASGEGDYPAACQYYEQSMAIKQKLGDLNGIGGSLNNIGFAKYRAADYLSAQRYYHQSLDIWQTAGSRQNIALSLQGFAEVAAALGQWQRTVELWSAVNFFNEQNGSPIPPEDERSRDRDLDAACVALGEETYAAAWKLGKAMTLNEVISRALGGAGEEPS